MLLVVYVVAGFFYGIAALLGVARTGVGDPNAGQTENLDAITAVVLGGTSLFGGRGMVLGSLVGAIVAAGGQYGRVSTILGFIAVIAAATNVVAGFLITDRMLGMFKHPPKGADTKGGSK